MDPVPGAPFWLDRFSSSVPAAVTTDCGQAQRLRPVVRIVLFSPAEASGSRNDSENTSPGHRDQNPTKSKFSPEETDHSVYGLGPFHEPRSWRTPFKTF